MTLISLPLFAQDVVRTRFQWGRIQAFSDWMSPAVAWSIVGLATFAILAFVWWLYLRDTRELPGVRAAALILLRTAAFLGILVLFLQPQWRTDREVTHNSRVVVLADGSLSMGLTDMDTSTAGMTRAQQVAATLEQTAFIDQLRKTHDVVVFRFDEGIHRITTWNKILRDAEEAAEKKIDWQNALKPMGKETRLGQGMQQGIADQRNTPLSGMIVITDGGQNAGAPPETAIETAREAKIPIYTVGVGSNKRPVNVCIYELEAPERAYPGDPYSVTGMIQGQGLAGQAVTVQLHLKDVAKNTVQLVESKQAILGGDGEVVPVKFQLTPTETGRWQISLRVQAPRADRNTDDNRRDADIEIVDRKTKVLLLAGGPSREYQFLQAMLFRDKSTTLDVLLQTARQGMSQSGRILEKFPETREEMYQYDCIVAFDPQWQALDSTQVDLLESWVAEQGGGLIVIAGPVFAGQSINGWVQDQRLTKIRSLYPVEFPRRFTVMDHDTYTAKEPWPLDFTREGQEAEFLWLAESESASSRAWADFAGVFSHQPVRGPKSGATVYAQFSDPRAAQGSQQPVFFAGQFYGSGRTFYLGSGEMWRLRRLDEGYFEQFYTRLIRHVSQGRLLRQSSRGMLMVDKDRYILGTTAQIRAQLTNLQLQPLAVPSVPLEVALPAGGMQTITLRPDPSRAGMYVGQLTVTQEGAYRLELPIPESDNERLTRRLQVRLPDLERENPQRNDPLLTRIAESTGGKYYSDVSAAMSEAAPAPLAQELKDRTKTSILTESPNPASEQQWLKWMMFALCGVLFTEWIIRRLSRLA